MSVLHFLSTRPSDRNQILHTYSDRYGTHSHLNKFAPRIARKAGLIGNNLRNWTDAAWGRDDLGPTSWNCHLHPSLRFSGSSNHLIHAFLVAVASLGNLYPPKLLHLGTQHSIPHLFLLRFSVPPTATHQQDNSYGPTAAVAPCGEYQSSLYLSLTRNSRDWGDVATGHGCCPTGSCYFVEVVVQWRRIFFIRYGMCTGFHLSKTDSTCRCALLTAYRCTSLFCNVVTWIKKYVKYMPNF